LFWRLLGGGVLLFSSSNVKLKNSMKPIQQTYVRQVPYRATIQKALKKWFQTLPKWTLKKWNNNVSWASEWICPKDAKHIGLKMLKNGYIWCMHVWNTYFCRTLAHSNERIYTRSHNHQLPTRMTKDDSDWAYCVCSNLVPNDLLPAKFSILRRCSLLLVKLLLVINFHRIFAIFVQPHWIWADSPCSWFVLVS